MDQYNVTYKKTVNWTRAIHSAWTGENLQAPVVVSGCGQLHRG